MYEICPAAMHSIFTEIIGKSLIGSRKQSLATRAAQCLFITQVFHECQIARVLTAFLQILVDILTQPSRSLVIIDVVILARTEQRQAHRSAKASVQVIHLMFSHISYLLINYLFKKIQIFIGYRISLVPFHDHRFNLRIL